MGDCSTQTSSDHRNDVAGGGSSAEAVGDEGALAPRQTEGAALVPQQQRQGRDAPESGEQQKTKQHQHQHEEQQPQPQQQPQSPNNASSVRTARCSAEEAKLLVAAAGTGRRAAARHGSNPDDSCDRGDSSSSQSPAPDPDSPRSPQPRGSTIASSPDNASSRTKKTAAGVVAVSATAFDAEGVDTTSEGGATEQHPGASVSSSESTSRSAGSRGMSAATADALQSLTDDTHSCCGSSSNDLPGPASHSSTRGGKNVSPIRHGVSGGDVSPQGIVSPRRAAARSVNWGLWSSKTSGNGDGMAQDSDHRDNDNNGGKGSSVNGNDSNGRPMLIRPSSGSRSKHKRRRRHDGGGGGHDGAGGGRYRSDCSSRSTSEDPEVGTAKSGAVDQRGEPKESTVGSSSSGDGGSYSFTASGDRQNFQSRTDAEADNESHNRQHRDRSSPRGFTSFLPSRPTGRDEGGTDICQSGGNDVAPRSSSGSSASFSPPSSSHGGGSGDNSGDGDGRTGKIR
ncbi:unnamed protein product [Sphacelaria rigidula]